MKSALECVDFECEDKKYTDFIKNKDEAEALQADNTSITYLFRVGPEVAGYVTLAMGSLKKERVSEEVRRSHRFKEIPCLLLGQLARKSSYSGRGLGPIMVAWVFDTASRLSEEVGCRYVIVDAEPGKAEHYETHLWFKALPKRKGDKTTLMYFNLGKKS